MSGQYLDTGEVVSVTVITPESVKQEDGQGQLLVAMQPGVEIPAIGVEEVVIVTEGDVHGLVEQDVTEMELVDQSAVDMVPVGAMEEVEQDIKPLFKSSRGSRTEDDGSYARRSMIYMREGVQASKGPPPESSGDSESELSSDEDVSHMSPGSRKDVKKRDFAYRLQWRNKDMLEAMKSVEEKKMTIRGAAKSFLVPYSTLKDRVHGRVRHGTKPGVKTALSPEEEEELVRYIKDMEAAGFQMRNSDVRERAGELLRLNYGHSSPYGDGNSPGHNWLSGFMKRHSGIEFKRTMARSVIPSCSRQRQLVKKFYDITSQVFKKNRIVTKPERMYAVSQMKIGVFQKATVIYGASASGSALPPFVILKGQQKLKLTSAREAYPAAFFTSSPSGAVTEEIFLWWFRDHFLKVLPQHGSRPLVLFISEPCLNVSLQMYQLAKEERVIFISIPQGICHLLQPMDNELGQYLENCLSSKAKKWESENPGSMFTQKTFAQMLQKVWKKALTVEEITTKFSNVGIYPVNASAISTDKILSMSHALRETMRRSPSPTLPNDDDDDEDDDIDDPLQGLSLLSALSSHEYASIGRGSVQYGSQDNLDRSYEQQEEITPRKRILEEFNTPSTSQSSKRQKVQVKADVDDPEIFQRHMEPLVKVVEQRVSAATDSSKSTAKRKDTSKANHPMGDKQQQQSQLDVQSEIALARENLDQINRAVDSILSSESQSPISPRQSPRADRRTSIRSPKADSMKVVKIKVPSSKGKSPNFSVIDSSKRSEGLLRAAMTKPLTKIAQPQLVKKPKTTKIIFMLNKPTSSTIETVSQEVPINENASYALPNEHVSYSNVKVEGENIETEHVLEEPVETVEQEVNEIQTTEIYTTEDGTYAAPSTEIDTGYSLAGQIDDQPPQHLLQDEELDLDTVDTIMINGQLFKVIRTPKADVKQEEQVDLDSGAVMQYEDGTIATDIGGASVIHQEVVQDYEVSSFEVATDETLHNVIEEQVI